MFFACEEDKMVEESSANQSENVMKSSYAPMADNPNVIEGVIKIKLTRSAGDEISVIKNNGIVQSSVAPLNTLLSKLKATGMRRLFPYAGKFEERTRREGLHLWYVVDFDADVPVNKAVYEANQLKEIEIVEEQYKIKLPDTKATEVSDIAMTDEENPFNDPRLSYQWHYNNLGKFGNSKKGADINLFEAWKEETGKPNVIVCVVDGGVDFDHEDLKDNMHVNEAELNGTEGVDDDENGYVDDIYGYNFVSYSANIVPDSHGHGTHVAGTVAARNNNGIGVCGVAGGDGTPDSGIRLISSQIFEGNRGGNAEEAMKYGADNGAVICQNSWGYPYASGVRTISASLKEAIDYFIKYAGCDNDGNQLPDSPMKGGVVIFAAGNDNVEFTAVPASYDKVVAVTSMAPNFKKAYYSTYGTWADIMAPGGDQHFSKGEVLSTLPNDRYGYMQGTSMACPHVSGIAALIASKFGCPGFTNKDLKKSLITGLRPFNIDKNNPQYVGKLGAGYIDAYAVLAKGEDNVAPETPKITKVTPDFTTLKLEWASVADENDTTPTFYNLYYSEQKLNKDNYKDAKKIQINGFGYKVGEPMDYILRGLPLNTTFYIAIEAVDRWDATSEVSFTEGKTKENHTPVITRTDDTPIRITDGEKVELKLKVTDPDEGQQWSFRVTGYKRGVSYKKLDDGVLLKFRVSGGYGKFSLKVAVRDVFNASAEIEIPFEYYKNEPPVLSKEFEKGYAPVGKAYTIDLNEHFTDPEGEKMIFTAQKISGSFNVTVNDNMLSVTPGKLGIGTIEITAKDSEGETVKGTLDLQAVNDNIVYLVYPIPVTKILNVRLSNEVNNAKLTVRTLTGSVVYEKDVTVRNNKRLVALNLGKVSGGTYVLYAEANGETYKQTFIKY